MNDTYKCSQKRKSKLRKNGYHIKNMFIVESCTLMALEEINLLILHFDGFLRNRLNNFAVLLFGEHICLSSFEKTPNQFTKNH